MLPSKWKGLEIQVKVNNSVKMDGFGVDVLYEMSVVCLPILFNHVSAVFYNMPSLRKNTFENFK